MVALTRFPNISLLFSAFVAASTGQNTTPNETLPTVRVTVDTQTRYQIIDGFGISEAFQRARHIQRLPPSSQQLTLDLLFDDTIGAGLSILRNGIGSSSSYDRDWMKSILPFSPGAPNAIRHYEWDGDDAGQVWVTKEAMKRGVRTVYADAWSAPAFMKTNNNDSNGGYLCGVPGSQCPKGDWRQAYAEYLIQFLRFYKDREGISITHLGFVNEPDLNQTYASMQASGFQVASMLKTIQETLQASEFADSVKIVCCEATGWSDAETLLVELQTVPSAIDKLDIYSAHGYSVNPSLPFPITQKIWQTEWADLAGSWNPAWDDRGKDGEGISWANKILDALTRSNVSAFLYWIGAEQTSGNSALVRIQNGTVIPSARLWAFGMFSRFVKPGAVRVEARNDAGYVRVGAFVNEDGRVVLVMLNNGHIDVRVDVDIDGSNESPKNATMWVLNGNTTIGGVGFIQHAGTIIGSDGFAFRVGKRSMATFILKPSSVLSDTRK